MPVGVAVRVKPLPRSAGYLLIAAATLCNVADAAEVAQDRISLYSGNRVERTTTDLDETDDSRNFASEALFAASAARLNRPLTDDELRALARAKTAMETFNVLRLRPASRTALDLFFKKKHIADAQVTNFFAPAAFGDVELTESGAALQQASMVGKYGLLGRMSARHGRRTGLIEFQPRDPDQVNTLELNGAVTRRFASGDTVTIYPTYVLQDIDLDIPNPFARRRWIGALSFACRSGPESRDDLPLGLESSLENLFARRFDTRGLRYHGGVVIDEERFGTAVVRKRDWFAGATFVLDEAQVTRLTAESTLFTSEVEQDATQDSTQYRTGLTLERDFHGGWPITLTVPLRYDLALEGPKSFNHWRAGFQMRQSRRIGTGRPLYLNFAGGVAVERFHEIDKTMGVLQAGIHLRF